MIKRLHRFNPAKDDYVADVNPDSDSEGGCRNPDIDSMIYHSEKHGFYLQRRIVQIRKGRVWMTVKRHKDPFACSDDQRRCLTTVRPLTRAQVIRLILESYLPEQEGAKDGALKTLTSAGII